MGASSSSYSHDALSRIEWPRNCSIPKGPSINDDTQFLHTFLLPSPMSLSQSRDLSVLSSHFQPPPEGSDIMYGWPPILDHQEALLGGRVRHLRVGQPVCALLRLRPRQGNIHSHREEEIRSVGSTSCDVCRILYRLLHLLVTQEF